MLSQLYIENVAVIKQGEINFKNGFNVFTGETGAGKTILVTAINGILGGKLSKDIVRTGEQKAIITAIFENIPENVLKIIEDLGYLSDEELLISREITAEGKSSCRINGKPSTLSVLKEIAENLVNIHGQQDNNGLVLAEKQMAIIDEYGEHTNVLLEYKDLYKKLSGIKEQIQSLNRNESEKAQKIDILEFQIKEISDANLFLGEDEELEASKKLILNSQHIISNLSEADAILNEDMSATDMLNRLSDVLGSAAQYIPELSQYNEKCREYYYELKELGTTVRDYMEEMDFDPRALDDIETRLDIIFKLKRKYGGTLEGVLNFLDNAQQELDTITFSEERIVKLNKEYDELLQKIDVKAKDITRLRAASAKAFSQAVEKELKFLDMPSVKLVVDISEKELSYNGRDNLQMLISVNPGEPPKSISKIASGGEISRIMLAIKNVMADRDNIPTMIFDEVDTGVSGIAAQKIGSKLKQAALNRQVICVTHLAQVAAYGDTHFKILKQITKDKTFTIINQLEDSLRIQEIARIMVGENITDSALISAKELLNNSKI